MVRISLARVVLPEHGKPEIVTSAIPVGAAGIGQTGSLTKRDFGAWLHTSFQEIKKALKMLAQSSRHALTMARPLSLAARRWNSTAGAAGYQNILVDTVGANKDVSLITLNRPKAVRALQSLFSSFSDEYPPTLHVLPLPPATPQCLAECPQLPALP